MANNWRWHKSISPSNRIKPLRRLLTKPRWRKTMSMIGQESVDGFGPSRVLRQLSIKKLKLRRAVEADCKVIWEWSNEPDVRANSFSTENILWESHEEWFLSKINDPNSLFFIASNGDGKLIGQIRYDVIGSDAVVSVSIDKEHRWGPEVIFVGCKTICKQLPIKTIHAYIKGSNKASLSIFIKAGFINKGTTINQDQKAFHMVYEVDL